MSSFFSKPNIKVPQSPYAQPLESIAQNQQYYGNQYADQETSSILPFFQSLLGGTDPYSQQIKTALGPALTAFEKTATNPLQDDVTTWASGKYGADLGQSLAKSGLLGQGAGAGIAKQGMQDFYMNQQQIADQRRSAATGQAMNLIQAPYALQQAGAQGIQGLNTQMLGMRRAGADIYSQLYGTDQQRQALQTQLSQAAPSGLETMYHVIQGIFSDIAAVYGVSGGGGTDKWNTNDSVPGAGAGGNSYGGYGGYTGSYGGGQLFGSSGSQLNTSGLQMPSGGAQIQSPYSNYSGGANWGGMMGGPQLNAPWLQNYNYGGGTGANRIPTIYG